MTLTCFISVFGPSFDKICAAFSFNSSVELTVYRPSAFSLLNNDILIHLNFLIRTESELGKSVQHTLMDTEEFRYRLDMYDRFLRDILEYPHEKLINKFDI